MKAMLHLKSLKISALLLALNAIPFAVQAQVGHHVTVTNNQFNPNNLEIEAGDTVIWTNTSGIHNVNGTQATYASNPASFGNDIGESWTYTYVFNVSGTYDYQCDPHVEFGMKGKIVVNDVADTHVDIIVDFSSMNPHLGQDLWLALIDQESDSIVKRIHQTVTESFSIVLSIIETGRSYNIDFFADHNQNGHYDAPPADHAWRLEVPDLAKDTTIAFVHNTTFTNIEWEHQLTFNFLSMGPHVGQVLWLNVVDKGTGHEVTRMSTIVETEFTFEILGLVPGNSYSINFYADFNENGMYDAPPTDHAWKMDLDDVVGDTILTFTHNTSFTDIAWMNKLLIHFIGMNPHLGQQFSLYIFDNTNDVYVDTITIDPIPDASFDVESFNIVAGNSYQVDFFADHNGNGTYDAPPADHAWRIHLEELPGDTTIIWVHNTDFTNIFDEPSAVDPVKLADDLMVYPNPAHDYVRISGNDLPKGELQIRVFNNTGQLVKSLKLSNSSDHVTINISDLNKGAYHLLLENNGNRLYSKLLKSE